MFTATVRYRTVGDMTWTGAGGLILIEEATNANATAAMITEASDTLAIWF